MHTTKKYIITHRPRSEDKGCTRFYGKNYRTSYDIFEAMIYNLSDTRVMEVLRDNDSTHYAIEIPESTTSSRFTFYEALKNWRELPIIGCHCRVRAPNYYD